MKNLLYILLVLLFVTSSIANVEIVEDRLVVSSPDSTEMTEIYRDGTDTYIWWRDDTSVLYFGLGDIVFDVNSKLKWDASTETLFADVNGTFTDGTTTIEDGNYTGVGNITGDDVDISAGTGDYLSSGTIGAGAITGTSFTDGTLTISGGSITSAVNGTFSGTVQAEQLTSTDDASIAGNLFVNTGHTYNEGLRLYGSGTWAGSCDGGNIHWYNSKTEEPNGWTYINAYNHFVWDNAAQSNETDYGNAHVAFDTGYAYFAGGLATGGNFSTSTGTVTMGSATQNAGVFSMIQGGVTDDPTFSITQSGDDVTINQTIGDITMTAGGGNISFGNETIESGAATFSANSSVTTATGFALFGINSGDSYSYLSLAPGQVGDVGWVVMGGYPNPGDFTIREAGVADYLTIVKTTGAATFSGDVDANSFTGNFTGDLTGDVTGNVSGNAGTVTVADTDAACYVGLWESASGSLAGKTDAGLLYNAGTSTLSGADLDVNLGTGVLVTDGQIGIGTAPNAGVGLHIQKSFDENAAYGMFGGVVSTRTTTHSLISGLSFNALWQPASLAGFGAQTLTVLAGASPSIKVLKPDSAAKAMIVANAYGFVPAARFDNGDTGDLTITNFKNFAAIDATLNNGATITTAYAFYDPGMTAGDTNWGLYGLSAQNYLSGSLTIGDGLDVTGVTQLGDGGIKDHVDVNSTGVMTFHGDARFWQGIFLDTSRFKEPTSDKATLVNRGIGTAYEFSDNQDKEHVHVQVRLPGFWDVTEDLQAILLWDSVTTDANCDWEIRYQFRASDEAMDSVALDGTEADFMVSSGTSKGLNHSTIAIPAADFDTGDKFLRFTVYRDGNDAGDTLSASAYLHGIIVRGVRNKTGGGI